MKFLSVYCKIREAPVFINVDKIVLVTQSENDAECLVNLTNEEPVRVAMSAEEIVRKINGEDRTGIGFRTTR